MGREDKSAGGLEAEIERVEDWKESRSRVRKN